jgi:integrase/recombinase XerD
MLAIYKRHSADCPQKSRSYRRCDCPCWAEGTIEGKYYRESLKTRNWQRATEIVRDREAGKKDSRVTIKQATEAFIKDAEARQLRPPSLYKYRLLFKQLDEFSQDKGLVYITECEIEVLRLFRESWKNKNYSARKKLEALRTFFKFVHESGWLPTNPAKIIKPPKVEDPPTMPYSKDEVERVLAACDKYPDKRNAVRLRALTLLLRYSGLRITDAVTLTKQKIEADVLVLRTAKTGTDVRIPLPKTTLEALAAVKADTYYFWSGQGTTKSCVGDYQRAFKKLYELAEVENGHAHRWRDTFAVELLLAGVPIEQVSVLLGHQSIKVTEKHYSPWVKARQVQLEAVVRQTF